MPGSRSRSRAVSALLTGVIVAGAAACGPAEEETVTPTVELIDRSTQALATGALLWANGTYGPNCATHTNGSAWSLRIRGSDPMTNTALSVVKNDSDCVLTLTELVGSSVYETASDIALTTSYAGSASAFAASAQPLAFYANAMISSTTFASDFTVTILYSNDLNSASPTATATYASYSGTASDTNVAPPNYTAGFGSLVVTTDVAGVVESATGTVGLTAGSQAGQAYHVIEGSVGTSYADVDTAYTGAGAATAIASTIPAASLSLVGDTLPQTRTVIIANTSNGVRAYQVIRINFNAPS